MEHKLKTLSSSLVANVKAIVLASRRELYRDINRQLILTYWHIGREIVRIEQQHHIDSKSSRKIIIELSKALTVELGKGYSRSNLFNMRKFYLDHPSVQSVTGQLTWTHICELMVIDNPAKRSFYEKEAISARWSVRDLKRQIDSSLYERILLSSGKKGREMALELASKGQHVLRAEHLLKNPYVFEFLGIPDSRLLPEKELELKLIRHIEEFLLELGRGYMYVGSQQRVTLNNVHHYVDMVFYNKPLSCYILIELKTTKLTISDAGQLNTYLNYYKAEINDPGDNPPIGIILCTEKDEIAAEYILGGFENTVLASRYTTILPDRQRLIDEVESVLGNNETEN